MSVLYEKSYSDIEKFWFSLLWLCAKKHIHNETLTITPRRGYRMIKSLKLPVQVLTVTFGCSKMLKISSDNSSWPKCRNPTKLTKLASLYLDVQNKTTSIKVRAPCRGNQHLFWLGPQEMIRFLSLLVVKFVHSN